LAKKKKKMGVQLIALPKYNVHFFHATPKNAWQFHLHPFNSIDFYQKLSTKIFSIIQIHFFFCAAIKDNNATAHMHAALFLPLCVLYLS
jgi:hypothetical protein